MISPLCISLVNPQRSAHIIYERVSPTPPPALSHQCLIILIGEGSRDFPQSESQFGVLFYFKVLLIVWCHWKQEHLLMMKTASSLKCLSLLLACVFTRSEFNTFITWKWDMEKIKYQELKGKLQVRFVGYWRESWSHKSVFNEWVTHKRSTTKTIKRKNK